MLSYFNFRDRHVNFIFQLTAKNGASSSGMTNNASKNIDAGLDVVDNKMAALQALNVIVTPSHTWSLQTWNSRHFTLSTRLMQLPEIERPIWSSLFSVSIKNKPSLLLTALAVLEKMLVDIIELKISLKSNDMKLDLE